jgi:hypothetical protein
VFGEAWKLSLGRLSWERCPGTKALGRLGAGFVRQRWKSETGKGVLEGAIQLGWERRPGTKAVSNGSAMGARMGLNTIAS